MKHADKIFVAGHRGLVGSAIVRALEKVGYGNLVLRTRQELDLLDTRKVSDFFKHERPDYVFMAAAKVAGIAANNAYPAEIIYENLTIENNIIRSAYENKVKKLLFLGSSCIYPKFAEQPIKESALLTGALEPTNRAYAVAKIAGIVMCQAYNKQYGTNFISCMPTSIYGPNDNFDLEYAHVIPALMRRFHEAKEEGRAEVVLWGTGKPKREFLHADDLADACLFLMNTYNDPEVINIGTGKDITVEELAETIKAQVGFEGSIQWDVSRPDGTPRKVLDVSKIHGLGWRHRIALGTGLKEMYDWYLKNR